MPKQTRWVIKRSLEQAVNALENAQMFTIREGQRFETVHPEMFEKFCVIVAQIEHSKGLTKELIEAI